MDRFAREDVKAAVADATVVLDRTYPAPRHNHNHNAIELHVATAAWEGETSSSRVTQTNCIRLAEGRTSTS